MEAGNGITAEKIQQQVAQTKSGPVHQGTFRARRGNKSLYGVIPNSFAEHYGLNESDELEIYTDYDMGCVMVFPAEVIDSGE